ncbi:UDP-3-O-(3-hydroxymyristoyl)glucosamine N-acyltransferase [candidate division KSB1 bacterium]|nr:UDP-3-O-(3-hydroxymyristoyl)glucosamine N-acyltransferase [candidate division KSB1 bacterium]
MTPSYTTAQIAALVGGTVRGSEATVISGLAKIEDAGPHDLTFLNNTKYLRYLEATEAGAVLIAPGMADCACTRIEVADPYHAFQRLLELFYPQRQWVAAGVHPSAVIDPTARLEADVRVGALCYVGPGTVVGRGTVLYPHVVIAADVNLGVDCRIHSRVTIREGVQLGDRVVVQDGAVIGSDGFGFAPGDSGYQKIPQLGRVVIGDDVEIGANTTIDRATLGETTIGSGTKLDNLIQVAHNVRIGSHTVIAAQTGVSGSTRIGDNCRIGGQVGLVGHLRIGDGVGIAAQSGVASDVADGEIVAGSPSRPHALWKRIEAAVTRMPELIRRVRRLESTLTDEQTNDRTKS